MRSGTGHGTGLGWEGIGSDYAFWSVLLFCSLWVYIHARVSGEGLWFYLGVGSRIWMDGWMDGLCVCVGVNRMGWRGRD